MINQNKIIIIQSNTDKHLNQLVFNVNNDMFFKYSEYFRNALVRANYYDDKIIPNENYLFKFLANLLFGENNELNDKKLYIQFMNKKYKY